MMRNFLLKMAYILEKEIGIATASSQKDLDAQEGKP